MPTKKRVYCVCADAVYACVPPLPWKVTPEDVAPAWREDLRHLCICSVDPPGCRDIDDALHARLLSNGNVEVGVHIADVTHFLKPGGRSCLCSSNNNKY